MRSRCWRAGCCPARAPRASGRWSARGRGCAPASGAYLPEAVNAPPPVAAEISPVKAPDTFLTSVGPWLFGRTRTNRIAMMMIPVRNDPTSRPISDLGLGAEVQLGDEHQGQVADDDAAPEPPVL